MVSGYPNGVKADLTAGQVMAANITAYDKKFEKWVELH